MAEWGLKPWEITDRMTEELLIYLVEMRTKRGEDEAKAMDAQSKGGAAGAPKQMDAKGLGRFLAGGRG